MDKIFKQIFIASLFLFGVLVGGAAVTTKKFPYELFHEAQLWYWAWAANGDQSIEGVAAPSLIRSYLSHEEGSPLWSNPNRAGSGSELVLISGGLYQKMDLCPQYGCLAWIMDRQGKIHHTWSYDPNIWQGLEEKLSGDASSDEPLVERVYPASLHLYDNGDLLVSFHGNNTFPWAVGMAKFDKDSTLHWKKINYNHHWFQVDEAGMIYTPGMRIVEAPYKLPGTSQSLQCDKKKFYYDTIEVLNPDGERVEEIPILQALLDSGFRSLIHLNSCDPTHLNFVRPLSTAMAGEYPTLNAGDLLFSMRNNDSVAVLDRQTKRVKWIATGKTVGQHSPLFMGNNKILIFDNMGAWAPHGNTRVAAIDLTDESIETVFPRENSSPLVAFNSSKSGNIDLHESRKYALVAASFQGMAVEVDLESGEVLWKYSNTSNLTPFFKRKKVDMSQVKGANRTGVFPISAIRYVGSPTFKMNREERK